MKNLNNYITEKLKLNKNLTVNVYKYFPKTKDELREILEELLTKDKNADLNDIDVSEITNMRSLFEGLDPHNIDISKWDVSKVEDMSYMFANCANFNSDLSNWDVSNVKNMRSMFIFCDNFNSDLNKWNISKAENMYDDMFLDCTSLKNKPSWYKE